MSVNKQKYFGKDGLYFCGFWVSPTGQIRKISLDAQKIAKHIAYYIRESGSPDGRQTGSFRDLSAIGWSLPEIDATQVSINIHDFRTAPLH